MRKLAIAMALASTALAAPAVARDQSFYVGIEGGVMLVEDTDFDVDDFQDAVTIDHKKGFDVDVLGGYDFGLFRVEGELGYKRASVDEIIISSNLGGDGDIESDGSVRVLSAMANALLDFGDDDGWAGFVGGGVGIANVRYRLNFTDPANVGGSGRDNDRSFAYQGIAGVRKSISNNIDLGLKYRYFVAPKLDFDIVDGESSSRYKSHSLLASLIYNFAPPPPPIVVVPIAPPPPPPPAMQTCPDGMVILATDICPAPPPPPPPPPPEPVPERG